MSAVCSTCNDTHSMPLGDGTAMCTRCPTPCRRCASSDGRGAYCATTPCSCKCHPRRTAPPPDAPPTDEVATLRAQLATVRSELGVARVRIEEAVGVARRRGEALDLVTAERDNARWVDETRRKTVAAIIEQRDAALARAEQAERERDEVAEAIAAWLDEWVPPYMTRRDYGLQNDEAQVCSAMEMAAEAVRHGFWRTTKGPSR